MSAIDLKNPVWIMLSKFDQTLGVTEIAINGPTDIFYEVDGVFTPLDYELSQKNIDDFILQVAKFNLKEINSNNPMMNGSLPDGSRINIVTKPIRNEGPAISIRRFLKNLQSFESRPGIFGLNEHWVNFLRAAIKAKFNIIVSGGTGVGKTTFLNLLMQEIGSHDKKVIIEDVRELNVQMPNTIRMEATSLDSGKIVPIRELVKNSLRMRPDRIIIGEIRGEEIFDLLQAMNTGHQGCIATIHANTPRESLLRMENLFLLTGHEVPYRVIRNQIGRSIDIVIQISRNKMGQRVVSHIAEVTDIAGDQVLMQDIGVLHANQEFLVPTKFIPKKIDVLEKNGFSRILFQLTF